MATFTITSAQNIDQLTGKAGGDTYNINGGTLTIDQDTRYGLNTTTTTGPPTAIAISATDGGSLEVDARYVRLIPYDGGNVANAPAAGTTVTAGGATGKLICFLSALTAAPTAVGAATPSAGFIKIKQWNSVSYADNTAITFNAGTVTCNVNGVDTVGWISLVGDEAGTITCRRLGIARFRGAWYDLGIVFGNSRTITYQIPTQGEAVYLPGVQVETDVAGVYEWYPNAGSQTALLANVGTEAARGKVCWISATGILRFGHDGTNLTGGYLPPDNRKIRIPNIYMHSCTTAARATNQIPNATLATRFEFVATGAQIIMDTVSTAWYMNIVQAYSLSLNNVAINDTLLVQELATAATLNSVCVGVTQAQANIALNFALNLAGGTISNCTLASYSLAASGRYILSVADCDGWTYTNVELICIAATRGNATSGCAVLTRANNHTFNNLTLIGGRVYLTTCWTVTFTNTIYIDGISITTPTGNPMYAIDLGGGGCTDIIVDGITFGGLTMVQPYSGLLQIGVGCKTVKLRNIGTYNNPLDLGDARKDTITWTRSGAVASGNVTGIFNHGLKTGDIFYCVVSNSINTIGVGLKTIINPAPTSGIFMFACTNAGPTTGIFSYYPTMAAYPVLFTANAAGNDIKIQRVYTTHSRTGAYSADNSNKNVLFESFWADQPNTAITATLDTKTKGFQGSHAFTAQTNPVYGSHWLDSFTTGVPASSLSQPWQRYTTQILVTSSGHNLRSADRIVVTNTSSERAIRCGAYSTLLASGINTFSLVGLNAGDTTGSISYVPENGRIVILANEASAQTTSYVVRNSGEPDFTAAGTVYFPVSGDMMTWETPEYILGHTSFPVDEPLMGAGTLTGYNFKYSIDKNDGAGYHNFENLSYVRTAGSGAVYNKWVQMFDTTGVNSGDYIFGTNVAPLARADTIGPKTVYYRDPANSGNIGTVSGNLRFNQLPNEVIDPSGGIKLKIQAQSIVPSGTAWSSLAIYTYSNDYARQFQYTLDTGTVQLTGLVTGSRVKATKVSDGTLLFNGGESAGTASFDTSYIGAIRLEARQASSYPYYKPFVTQVTSIANTTVSAVALQQLD